jgi:lipid A 4'-phosphatase
MALFITASLFGLGLLGLLIGHWRGHESWPVNGTFLILSVVIGLGLMINSVFKDHWDRPRPRDVVQFGGTLHYTPAPLRGKGSESFPCGHCSVGFLYAGGWWLWRRRWPHLARASLTLGLA